MINKRLQFDYIRVYLVQIKKQKMYIFVPVPYVYVLPKNKHAAGTSHSVCIDHTVWTRYFWSKYGEIHNNVTRIE